MSIRKRPPNLQDGFDSTKVGTYDQTPVLNQDASEAPTFQSVPNLTITQALSVIAILLKDFQSKHFQIGEDPWYQWFPYAWQEINIGDEIKNLDTNEIYRVAEIVKTDLSHKRNLVKLLGAKQPKKWHILRLDDKKNNVISIVPAYPDAEPKILEFGDDGYIKSDKTDNWLDVITYTIVDEQPGSRDKKMFGQYKELTPKYRETINDTEIYGQWIDSTIRFDFWTLSNKSSEMLREWFRDFANKYRWLVQANGVSQFHWTKSYTDMNAARWRSAILHRSALYDLRTEYSFTKNLNTIREIDISATITRMADEGQEKLLLSIDNTITGT